MTELVAGELQAAVEAWTALDPDPATRAEAAELLATGNVADLEDRFARRLEFGTAGLRGAVGAGSNRMNRLVVRQTAAGLMRWLPHGSTVVIGYDARPTSESFAEETAAVVRHFGGTPVVGVGPLPTPALAHAVLHRSADAGVMVTASHNPRGDNGYKVYLADGIQLVPPADAEIEAQIVRVAEGPLDVESAGPESRVDFVGPYLDDMAAFLGPAEAGGECDLRVVYTAMHGVGSASLRALFDRVGLPTPFVVAAQDEPDGEFPTTAFPNPEEPGALDLAFELASEIDAHLVIANDPDADRLGIALPSAGGWARLSGDDLGLLLADTVLRRTSGNDRIVASSIVSSTALAALADRHGVPHESTLTGFKWVARVGNDSGRRLVFGYEEALGYAVTPLVRDKDGITAAAELVRLACGLRAAGSGLGPHLDELMADIGVFVTAQRTKRVDGAGAAEQLSKATASLRSNPPKTIGPIEVAETVDLLVGAELPPTDALIYHLADGSRVILRPSGTEPKLKAYLEANDQPGERGVEPTRSALRQHLEELGNAVDELLDQRLQ